MDLEFGSKSSADISYIGNPFLHIPENGGSDLVVFSQDIHSSVLKELTGRDGEKVSGSFSETIKALLPENVFPRNPTAGEMAISQRQLSSTLQFLKLTIYLVSNNFFESTTDVSKKVYEWIKRRSNAGLMEYLFSIGGPTVEALTENLFRLAIDAEDVSTINTMMKLGINPNEQVYRDSWGYCDTALNQACVMQSLKLVKALIDGGAKVDLSIGNNDAESVLMSALEGFDEDYEPKAHIDIELVQILLDAGAAVNPGLGQSPLANAVEWGHVEAVELLVSAGANVNITVGEDDFTSTPLTKAVGCGSHIPETGAVRMARILLNAGADPQGVGIFDGEAETALEIATRKQSIGLIQLLLENGARVTEPSFVGALRFCDINVVKLLLRFGGQVTETVIECAVEKNSILVFFLLEATDGRTRKSCKTAALIKSIECRKMDLIHKLGVSGAQLKKTSKLKDAIQEVIKAGDTDVLRFLLDEKSGYRILSLESLDTALWAAITNGRDDIVELLLMAGANVNGEGDYYLKNSPLLAAIRKKNLHLAKQLLVAGAAVNGRAIHQLRNYSTVIITTTVLPAAVDWGYHPLIEDIIKAGAEIDAPEKGDGATALFVAVEKKDTKSVKLLIDAGANVNTFGVEISGQTALGAASQNNDLQMVQYLLGLGADPDEWSLMVAISGSLELVQTVLVARLHRYKRYSKSYGCGALQHAIRLKNATMIEILLAEGIDANVIIHRMFEDVAVPSYRLHTPPLAPYLTYGGSALGSAIKWDKSEDSWIVRMLLRGGADPNSIVTDDRQTALLVAIGENNLALVKVLIAAGAGTNPNLRSGVQRTPLQLAVEKGRIDIVNILLDNGVDINAPPFDRYGATALQFAAIGGYIGIAQLLMQRGADINASPAKIGGRTALEGAAEHGRIDMLQLLLNAGALIIGTGLAQYDRARELALENGHRAACQLLEKFNTDIWENSALWDDMWMNFSSVEKGLPL
jgi:ankyrin repeat protein